MRLNGICQLGVNDLTDEHAVGLIPVRAGAARRLKTENAQRVIPLHEELTRCGFLEFVDQTRRARHERLFPDSRWIGAVLQRRFPEVVRALSREAGAKAPETSFHSFRHSFTDALRRAGAAGEAIEGLLGWSRGNMHDRYGSGPWIAMLAELLQRATRAST